MARLENTVAIITGGARGMGAAHARAFVREGARVVIADVLDGEGRALADELGEAVRYEHLDVTSPSEWEAVVAATVAAFGTVDVLVNNAGIGNMAAIDKYTLEMWNAVLAVNLTGTFHCCQAVLPDMVAAGWGRVITISSSSAQRGSPTAPAYAAAKGGVIVLTKAMARAHAAHGITVNTIPPSGIETPMLHKGSEAGHLPSNEVMAGAIPMGYLGTPDDIAAAATFLASDDAGYITGQVLGVNGGSVM